MARRRNDNRISMVNEFADLRADYAAARSNRMRRSRTGIPLIGAGADYHYRSESDLFRIMEYARDMDRNDCVIGQMVSRAVDNAIQSGMTLDVDTGDAGLDKQISNAWAAWSCDPRACDEAWQLSFPEMEWAILRQQLVDGEIFVLPVDSGRLQLIEAERLRTPSGKNIPVLGAGEALVCGVHLAANRKRLNYCFTKDALDPCRGVTINTEFDIRAAYTEQGEPRVLHIYNPKRVSQTRGVSAFAPIFDVAGMFEDINFAKLVQAQIVSCFTIFRERPEAFAGGVPGLTGEASTETLADSTTRTIQGIAPGLELSGAAGEKLHGFSPAVPNAEYFDHVKLMLRIISVNFGLPLEVALLDPSQSNFSSWRGSIDQARIGFRRNQAALIARFHEPVYRWFVQRLLSQDNAMLRMAGRNGISVFGHKWNPPRWPYIEPLKDAQADLLRLSGTLISPRRLHAERGEEWAEVAAETIEDNAKAIVMAKARAAEINSAISDGNPVHWRELLSTPLPQGVSVAIGSAARTASREETEDAAI